MRLAQEPPATVISFPPSTSRPHHSDALRRDFIFAYLIRGIAVFVILTMVCAYVTAQMVASGKGYLDGTLTL